MKGFTASASHIYRVLVIDPRAVFLYNIKIKNLPP